VIKIPYIDQRRRTELNSVVQLFHDLGITDPGELNYLITNLLLKSNPTSYRDYNGLTGVLECVKLELYRKAIAPYEERKEEDNGSIY